ncbi:hypothetical protein QBC34DRAFT_393719 [Podospora aff. communis PSN243]|uniref:WW domain-containing protein n=1 Tax=Podospora aff. communis PSN243 TaxID=3040156 RepID=A0AAV9H1J8_9PEZI|nr:hypothetical protein QBC34DRAFT_393719 [Podospora aff. communis PSN243]
MADGFLAEQSAWTIAQIARTNDEDSWVMLTRDGKIVPIPGEKILYTSRTRVALEVTTPKELQVAEPFSIKNGDGVAYITNERVIYLPATPSDQFKSFFSPILNFTDTHVQSSWIGPWSWSGVVRPVPGGGVPMGIPRIDVKLTFKDGGHSDFQSKFEWLKERLHHAQELGMTPGQNFEPPPPYDPDAPGPSSGGPGLGGSTNTQAGAADQNQPPLPAPDEPPPDYLEAQTSAVTIQYEERMRQEAERR